MTDRYDLYQCNRDDSARYALGRLGERMLCVLGLNPSTANRDKPDMTVARVERIAQRRGFDGFAMLNLYPARHTLPGDLPRQADSALQRSNLRRIRAVVGASREPVIWAAWGGDIVLRDYLPAALASLAQGRHALPGRWMHYGELRKDGHPRHPSRASYDWDFHDFDVADYLDKQAPGKRRSRD